MKVYRSMTVFAFYLNVDVTLRRTNNRHYNALMQLYVTSQMYTVFDWRQAVDFRLNPLSYQGIMIYMVHWELKSQVFIYSAAPRVIHRLLVRLYKEKVCLRHIWYFVLCDIQKQKHLNKYGQRIALSAKLWVTNRDKDVELLREAISGSA